MSDKKRSGYQMIVLIATPKLTDKAADLFLENSLPVQFRLNAEGTASSEIMDTLGFGSVDKSLLISMVPKSFGKTMLGLLHSRLRLDAVNSGIAFTLSLTGASNILLKIMDKTEENLQKNDEEESEITMTESKHTLIAAIVDRGFGSEVMDAARAAGAGGGTIVHSRAIENPEATGFWGLSVQDEREIVLILAGHKNKLDIMSAISDRCGMASEAKGMVVSFPIDSVMGL